MSVRVNVCMSKIMLTPIKVGVGTYITYANCRTLTEEARLVKEQEPKGLLPSLEIKTLL